MSLMPLMSLTILSSSNRNHPRHSVLPLFAMLSALLLLAPPSLAGVNLKNGNYYVSYTDVSLKLRHELEITRTYNSKSVTRGHFGIGWGFDFETRVLVLPDGNISVHENGGGARTLFRPATTNQAQIERAVESILDAADSDGRFRDAAERQRAQSELLRDSEVRESWWKRYRKKGLLPPRDVPIGSLFVSRERGFQTLIRSVGGFQRIQASSIEDFDAEGRLVRMAEKDGDTLQILRDNDGRLQRIVNSEGHALLFHLNDDGTIAGIDASRNGEPLESARYSYLDGRLVKARDAENNVYRYRYDANANLISIAYADGSQRRITYDGTESWGNQFTRSVAERSGSVTWYRYGTTEETPTSEAYFTETRTQEPDGDVTTAKYEYWIRYLPDGDSYTSRIRTTRNGRVKDTRYDRHGLPLGIAQGDDAAQFKYDDKGRLIRKNSGGQVTELSYDDRVNKISRVLRYPENQPEDRSISEFSYNPDGDLLRASNSEGRWVELEYNADNQIQVARSEETTLTFAYGRFGKPVSITVEGVGRLDVTYDDHGEILSVDSSPLDANADISRTEISMRVTRAFQTLLTLVKPAGVDLGL